METRRSVGQLLQLSLTAPSESTDCQSSFFLYMLRALKEQEYMNATLTEEIRLPVSNRSMLITFVSLNTFSSAHLLSMSRSATNRTSAYFRIMLELHFVVTSAIF